MIKKTKPTGTSRTRSPFKRKTVRRSRRQSVNGDRWPNPPSKRVPNGNVHRAIFISPRAQQAMQSRPASVHARRSETSPDRQTLTAPIASTRRQSSTPAAATAAAIPRQSYPDHRRPEKDKSGEKGRTRAYVSFLPRGPPHRGYRRTRERERVGAQLIKTRRGSGDVYRDVREKSGNRRVLVERESPTPGSTLEGFVLCRQRLPTNQTKKKKKKN